MVKDDFPLLEYFLNILLYVLAGFESKQGGKTRLGFLQDIQYLLEKKTKLVGCSFIPVVCIIKSLPGQIKGGMRGKTNEIHNVIESLHSQH